MLFASTRLTLVRELGPERFREQVFATDKDDLTKDGWEKHEAHGALGAPLTEEEEVLGEVRRKEAEEGRGTGERKSHLSGHKGLVLEADAVKALEELKVGRFDLVMLVGSP